MRLALIVFWCSFFTFPQVYGIKDDSAVRSTFEGKPRSEFVLLIHHRDRIVFIQAVMVVETDRDFSLFVLDHHVDPVTKLHARVWFGKGWAVGQLDAMPTTFEVIEKNHVVADLEYRPARG